MEFVYQGFEGELLPFKEADQLIENYTKENSEKIDYTKYEVFGRRFLEEILNIQGVVALRFYNGKGEQTQQIIKAYNQYGEEIEIPKFAMKGDDTQAATGSPRCPRQC